MLANRDARDFAAEDAEGGCADGSGSRIRLERTGDRSAIGNPAYATYDENKDLFLDFAGWDNTNAYNEGSLNYLAEIFSGLGAAMNPGLVTPVPLGSVSPTPDFGGTPQPTDPAVYAEVEWAGMYPFLDARTSDVKGMSDFDTASMNLLRPYVALNYYYLYPATELPAEISTPETSVFTREAQWEAITVFLEGDPLGRSAGREGRRPPGSLRDAW
jgi:hypothetical protein